MFVKKKIICYRQKREKGKIKREINFDNFGIRGKVK